MHSDAAQNGSTTNINTNTTVAQSATVMRSPASHLVPLCSGVGIAER
jgi:hypothetical protein